MADKELWVRIRANATELEQAAGKIVKTLEPIGRRLQSIGRDWTRSVTLPIVAAGAGVLKAGSDFDEAFRKIRAGTGATGDALARLREDFVAVFRETPTAAAELGTALADLSTRTGLVGEPLRRLTRQVAELAGLTESDLASLVPSVTRVFGDWAIATERQSEALDFLFRTSQATGAAVDEVSRKVVRFGAPMRQMGFSFEEATALVAKFEKEGVNLEVVLNSLRIGLARMAREGVNDPAQAFDLLITRIRDAGSAGEATRLAIAAFGAEAGVDMAAAIREGRFELGSLVNDLRTGKDTILGVAEETRTFRENLIILGHGLEAAAQPLGEKLIKGFRELRPQLERAIGFVGGLVDAFTKLPPGIQTGTFAVVGLTAAIGPLLSMMGHMVTAFAGVARALRALMGASGLAGLAGLLTPGGLLLAGVGALAGALIVLNLRAREAAPSVQRLREQLQELQQTLPATPAAADAAIVALGGRIKVVSGAIADLKGEASDPSLFQKLIAGLSALPGSPLFGTRLPSDRREAIQELEAQRQEMIATMEALVEQRRALSLLATDTGGGGGGSGGDPLGGLTSSAESARAALTRLHPNLEAYARGVLAIEESQRRTLETTLPMNRAIEDTRELLGSIRFEVDVEAIERFRQIQAAAASMAESVGAAFEGFVTRTQSFVDAVRQAVTAILRELLRLQIQRSIVGPLSGVFSNLLGAGSAPAAAAPAGGGSVSFFQHGGRFNRGTLAMVGERGRELVAFDGPGRVHDASRTEQMLRGAGGGRNVSHQTIEMHAHAVDRRAMVELLEEHAGTIAAIMRQVDRET